MAQKLPMSGVLSAREKVLGEGAGAGAGAGGTPGGSGAVRHHPSHHLQQQQQIRDGGGGSGTHAGGGVAGSSVMQPSPLASRSGAATKQESIPPPSSALGSSWIRRVLLATPDVPSGQAELGHEGDILQPPLLRDAAASRPPSPLCLPVPPASEQRRDLGMINGSRETVAETTVFGNGHILQQQRGKAHHQEWGHRQPEVTTAALNDLGMENDMRSSHGKGLSLGSYPRTYPDEGSSRQQQQQQLQQQDKHQSTAPVMTGFGSLRAIVKPPRGNTKKPAETSNFRPRLSLTEKGDPLNAGGTLGAAAAGPLNGYRHLSSVTPDGPPGRIPTTSAKFTAPPIADSSKDLGLGTDFGRNTREFSWVGPGPNRIDVEADNAVRPVENTIHVEGARETPPFLFSGSSKAVDPPPARPDTFASCGDAQSHLKPLGRGVGGEERIAPSVFKKPADKFLAPPSSPGVPGRKENAVHQGSSRSVPVPAAVEGNARASYIYGSSKGIESSRKMKEPLNSEYSGVRDRDVGSSQHLRQQQQLLTQEAPHYAAHPLPTDFPVGQTLPFSPRGDFPGEGDSEDVAETNRGNSRAKAAAEQTQSLLTPLYDPGRRYQEGPSAQAAAGQSEQPERQTPWTGLFGTFKGHKRLDPPNPAPPARAAPPPDLNSRFFDLPTTGNRASLLTPKGSRNLEENSSDWRGGGANEANRGGLFSGNAANRNRLDSLSSQFSNSPWVGDEGHTLNEDVGSCFHNSPGAGSGHMLQPRRAPNAAASGDISEASGRHREMPANDRVDRFPGGQAEDAGRPRMPNDENQAQGSPGRLRHINMHSMSGGQNDNTSGSTPPSYPAGYNNSSDLGSPSVLPRVHGFEQLNRAAAAGQLRTMEVEFEMEANQGLGQQVGYANSPMGGYPRTSRGVPVDIPSHENELASGDYGEASALHLDAQKTQPAAARDAYRDVVGIHGWTSEAREPGTNKHGRFRTSDEAIGDATSGPSKRKCYQSNAAAAAERNMRSQQPEAGAGQGQGQGQSSTGQQGNEGDPGRPSTWLQRWLKPSSSNTSFAQPRNLSDNAFPGGGSSSAPRGNTNLMGVLDSSRHRTQAAMDPAGGTRCEGNRGRPRSNLRHPSGVRAFVTDPTPSAAALALASTAAKKPPVPQQRRGSMSIWPPVRINTTVEPPAEQRSP